MRHLSSSAVLLFAAALACVDPVGVPHGDPARLGAFDAMPNLGIYGLGDDLRAFPGNPCAVGASRQFDFWLGEWAVQNAAGNPAGNSRILSTLNGCGILEYWLPFPGFLPGRSLNGYDAEAGVWRQTWVSANGRPFRMSGNLDDGGVMRMSGTRFATNGWHWIDTYSWTPVDADHVVQVPQFDLPELNLHIMGRLTYTRVPSFVEQPLDAGTRCISGDPAAQVRALDFTVGDWTVTAGNGTTIGTSSVVVDPTLSGCLLEETFQNDRGYASRAFMYYDPVEGRFSRSSMDNRGNWVELRGPNVTADPSVLEGVEQRPGADLQIRLVWERVNADELKQTWFASNNEGQTWTVAQVLTFTRR